MWKTVELTARCGAITATRGPPSTRSARTTRIDTVVVIENLIFSVPLNKLLWAGVTETTNPKDAAAAIKDIVAATRQGDDEGRPDPPQVG